MKFNQLILISLFLWIACKNSQSASSEKKQFEKVLTKAYTELGSPITVEKNPEGNYILCIKESKENPTNKEFLVIKKETNEIILPKSKIKGVVKWHSDTFLKVIEYPGHIEDPSSKPEDNAYYIEIKEKSTKEF